MFQFSLLGFDHDYLMLGRWQHGGNRPYWEETAPEETNQALGLLLWNYICRSHQSSFCKVPPSQHPEAQKGFPAPEALLSVHSKHIQRESYTSEHFSPNVSMVRVSVLVDVACTWTFALTTQKGVLLKCKSSSAFGR